MTTPHEGNGDPLSTTTSNPTTDGEAREYLREVGISDPTPALVEMARETADAIRDGLAADPTMNDYAGAVTEAADSAAAGLGLGDIAGSHDAVTFEHGLGEMPDGLEGNARAILFEIATGVAWAAHREHAPNPADVRWADVPASAHGDILIGRNDRDGFVYVGVRIEQTDHGPRVSISGHTADSAGQIRDALADITPAPGFTREDLAELARVWDRWHLSDMRAECEHQRRIADKMGKRPHEVFTTTNTRTDEDGRYTGNYGRGVDGKQASHARTTCPVCGYAYGSEWRRETVPAEVFDFLARFTTKHDAQVREILQTENPSEPGGEWSAYGVAVELARRAQGGRPCDFDAQAREVAPDHLLGVARAAIGRLCPGGGRYVGGTSGYLYHLPRAGTEGLEAMAQTINLEPNWAGVRRWLLEAVAPFDEAKARELAESLGCEAPPSDELERAIARGKGR